MTRKKGKGGVKEANPWKPVQVEDMFTEGTNFDGLIGIEELTEYDLENYKGNSEKTKKRATSPASGGSDSDEEVEVQRKRHHDVASSDEETVEEAPHKKKKRKQTKKRAVKSGWDVTEDEKNEDVDMSGWQNLFVPEPVLKALQELGFAEPSKIQSLTLPPAIMGRRDILGAAETGSGKTLAFGIPLIHRILDYRDRLAKGHITEEEEMGEITESEDENVEDTGEMGCVKVEKLKSTPAYDPKMGRLHGLILTPTRELAVQVRNHLVAAVKYCDIRVATIVGGMAQEKQERVLKKCPEIVVATPGRLWELIKEGNPFLQQVDRLPCLIIDEADRMMEKGHFQELRELLERMDLSKISRQTLVFSATLTLVHDPPRRLSVKKNKGPKATMKQTPGQKLNHLINLLGMKNPKIVDITAKEGTVETLTEAYISCRLEEKDALLFSFIRSHPGRTLVFLNSVSSVRRLANLFTLLQCSPVALHAQMIQKQRLRSLEKFASNPKGLLLATDVAARGLDIVGVQHVIHYHVPRTSENYVHRSGRTARAQKEGLTVLYVEAKEMALFKKLCYDLGKGNELPEFPVDRAIFDEVRKRVEFAKELEQLEHSHRRTQADEGWLNKAVKELDLYFDEHDRLPTRAPTDPTETRKLNMKRKVMNAMLKMPLVPHRPGVSGKYPTSSGGLVVPYAGEKKGEAVKLVKDKKPAVKNLGQELGFKKRRKPKFSSKKKPAKV